MGVRGKVVWLIVFLLVMEFIAGCALLFQPIGGW